MPTQRGFVESLEIGRAGQATAFLLHGDGSKGTYTIGDLDADPERFNERLSQLGFLRDAMNRAEPVEVEFDAAAGKTGGGGAITRVRRLTRDELRRPVNTDRVSGQVVGLAIRVQVMPELPEPSDAAVLALITTKGIAETFLIPLQMPERGTAEGMVELAQAAQASGSPVTVEFEVDRRLVTALQIGDTSLKDLHLSREVEFDGFVEEMARVQNSELLLLTLTTAPNFAAAEGNVVPLKPFTPELRRLAVLRGSPEFIFFEAALRDLLRVRVVAAMRTEEDQTDEMNNETIPRPLAVLSFTHAHDQTHVAPHQGEIGLVRGVRLLAPLCSAARPVWIQVNRQALDVGPTGECVGGLPTSDLTPRSIRMMNLPYRAEWLGLGCFNHGVYRFQLSLDVEFILFVDDQPVCIHRDEETGVDFGHACLEGEHRVKVILEGWSCQKEFKMDVYRLR